MKLRLVPLTQAYMPGDLPTQFYRLAGGTFALVFVTSYLPVVIISCRLYTCQHADVSLAGFFSLYVRLQTHKADKLRGASGDGL